MDEKDTSIHRNSKTPKIKSKTSMCAECNKCFDDARRAHMLTKRDSQLTKPIATGCELFRTRQMCSHESRFETYTHELSSCKHEGWKAKEYASFTQAETLMFSACPWNENQATYSPVRKIPIHNLRSLSPQDASYFDQNSSGTCSPCHCSIDGSCGVLGSLHTCGVSGSEPRRRDVDNFWRL